MKVYEGKPGGRVIVHDGTKKPRPLDPKLEKLGFAWGKPTIVQIEQRIAAEHPELSREEAVKQRLEKFKRAYVNAGRLALALLLDALENEQEAMKYYVRFKDRTISTFDPDAGWSMSTQDIVATIVDIKQTYQDTAQTRRMAMQEPTPFVSERGADVVWHKDR